MSTPTLDTAITCLSELIRRPSYSRDEQSTADWLEQWAASQQLHPQRTGNNVWAIQAPFNPNLPTVVMVSHHDTVRPNTGYTRDPFDPALEDGCLYGLGSNDAGASLVVQALSFSKLRSSSTLPCNLFWVAAAEEEISGAGGVSQWLQDEAIQQYLAASRVAGTSWVGIVGEPTGMQLAIAERGLVVLDGYCLGQAGHAAREEGINAIDLALADIQQLKRVVFPEKSKWLPDSRLSVTVMYTENRQHNVVPAECRYVIDLRLNECVEPEVVVQQLQQLVSGTLTPRSFRLRPTYIEPEHPLVQAGTSLGLPLVGSATLSDKALLPFPAVKVGPGDSARSHTADEFIRLAELEEGLNVYEAWLKQYFQTLTRV